MTSHTPARKIRFPVAPARVRPFGVGSGSFTARVVRSLAGVVMSCRTIRRDGVTVMARSWMGSLWALFVPIRSVCQTRMWSGRHRYGTRGGVVRPQPLVDLPEHPGPEPEVDPLRPQRRVDGFAVAAGDDDRPAARNLQSGEAVDHVVDGDPVDAVPRQDPRTDEAPHQHPLGADVHAGAGEPPGAAQPPQDQRAPPTAGGG